MTRGPAVDPCAEEAWLLRAQLVEGALGEPAALARLPRERDEAAAPALGAAVGAHGGGGLRAAGLLPAEAPGATRVRKAVAVALLGQATVAVAPLDGHVGAIGLHAGGLHDALSWRCVCCWFPGPGAGMFTMFTKSYIQATHGGGAVVAMFVSLYLRVWVSRLG